MTPELFDGLLVIAVITAATSLIAPLFCWALTYSGTTPQ